MHTDYVHDIQNHDHVTTSPEVRNDLEAAVPENTEAEGVITRNHRQK